MSDCEAAEQDGVFLLHGNRGAFHNKHGDPGVVSVNIQPAFQV
jgi:hypothetical protein